MKKLAVSLILCCLLLAVIFAAAYRRSNPDPAIRQGERREGFLDQSDPIRDELPRGRESRWRFEGREGQRITVAAESYEFDVYLLLIDPLNRPVGSGDNNGWFFNARIQTALQKTGQYTVVVCGANADQLGTYWLSLEEGDRDVDLSQAAVESYYRRGTEWSEGSMNRRALSWLNLGMARYYRERRQFDKAYRYYADSLARAEEDGFTYGEWAVTLEQGRLFARRRQYDRAAGEFQRALQLSRGLRASAEAETLTLIETGKLYYSTARADLAKVYFENALKQAEQYALPSTLVELYTSLNTFLRSQDRDRAINYAEKSRRLCNGLDPVLELNATHALAGTYLFLEPNRSQEGLALASEMRDRANRLGCPDQEVAAITLMSMSKYATNETEEMVRLAGEALKLTDPADEDPNPARIALQLQADGEMSRGNYEAALRWCLKALQIVEAGWANERIEELRRELLSQSRAICTQIIRNLYALNARHPSTEYIHQAFDYAERSRSRSLLEQLLTNDRRMEMSVDRQLLNRDREIFDKLSAVRGQMALLRTSDYASQDALRRLQGERATIITERMRLQAEIRQSLMNSYHAANLSPVTAEQAQKRIAEYYPNSAILYYQLGIQESFLIVSTRRGSHFFKLPDWKAISQTVADWRAQIWNQLNSSRPSAEALYNYHEVAHRLYKTLVKPAAHLIRGHDLIIIPSNALCQIAFETLVVNDPGRLAASERPRYLVEQYAVSYVPSASVLYEIESRREMSAPTRQMLLLGDAVVGDNKTTTGDQQPLATALDQLPAARLEVLRIGRLAKQHDIIPTILLGPQANEDKFKNSNLSTFRFNHIATHGISDSQDGGASALTLAPHTNMSEDGILTSDEVTKLKLKSDLVVLSGCETSLGQEDGAEGIVGLNRAFLIAGARSVCGSLWPVEDSSTQKLMSAFYESLLADGHNKSQALRLAKLKLLKRGAPPSRWASFILVGSPR